MRLTIVLFLIGALSSQATAQPDQAVFSASGGCYEHCFYLAISCQNPNHHIRYTTNGNSPTAKSTRYVEPLFLNEHLYSTSDIHTIRISPEDLVYIPDSVRHAIVIRAAVFDQNDQCVSKTVTNTYLIHDLGWETNDMAVVSLCADSLDLFDYETGIFVPGAEWDPDDPDHTGNYYQPGQEWERPVNIEFYEPGDNDGMNQLCGLRTHGNRSRRQPAKGMKIYAREEYGKKRFDHPFFPDASTTSFKHLILKPFATFWPFSGVQDYFCNALALQVGLDAPLCRPVLLFLNGAYWGVYFIQEKTDERFLEDHYGIDIDQCNIIGNWKGEVEHGDNAAFKKMLRWFKGADLSKDADYDHACSLIDMDRFIDYLVFETFVGNWDWPGNNMRCWQEKDGRWRWLFFDGDATIQKLNADFDVFSNAALYTSPATWGNYPEAKLLFGKLLESNRFKEAFKERAQMLCDGPFQYENTFPLFNDMVEILRPWIQDQMHRFGYPVSIQFWENGNGFLHEFLQRRVEDYLQAMEGFPLFKTDFRLSDLDLFYCFPNPTNGDIGIKPLESWPHSVEIVIYDLTGRMVFHQTRNMSATETIGIENHLPAGVYLIKIGSHSQRLIKF